MSAERSMASAGEQFQLGLDCLDRGQLEPAESAFRRALELDPRHAKAGIGLGVVLQRSGRQAEAERCYRDALSRDDKLAQGWFNLGTLLLDCRRPDDAADALRRALALDAARAEWHAAFAWSLLQSGDAQAAVAAYRKARTPPSAPQDAHSGLLRSLNFVHGLSAEQIFRERLAWGRRASGAAAHDRAYANDLDAERKLRVGYLCPDFRDPGVRYFIEPVLACHERSRIEVVCYSDALAEDPFSWRLRARHPTWHAIAPLDHAELAQRIRQDRIDILVDLAGHGAGGVRMALLAMKPAPVQVSWLGDQAPSGLDAIDYRIADWHGCPEGDERWHSERLVRMPGAQWCFHPDFDAPDPGPLPARNNGAVTFGSFAELAALTPRVIALWAGLLRRLPGSKLLLSAAELERLPTPITDQFQAQGVAAARLEFAGRAQADPGLALHRRVDLCLDAFPGSSAAPTCHALWMGVPVVALRGATLAARCGSGILAALGLEELIGSDEEEYATTAAALAADLGRLEQLRGELRPRLAQSPLAAAERFTLELESAYRRMWRDWCARVPARDLRIEPVSEAPQAAMAKPAHAPRRDGYTVVVDGVFFQEHNTGIARVWRSLLGEWVASGFARRIVLLDRGETAPKIDGFRRRSVAKHAYARLAEDRAMLQRVCDEERAAVFISTYYSTPLVTPVVMLAYDMIPEALGMDLAEAEWQEKEHCIRRATRYVAISASTARDLHGFFPWIAADRIRVAYPGLDASFRPVRAQEVESFKQRLRITRPYFLLVGARDGYKNAIAFFASLARLPDRARYGIVCVGGEDDLQPEQRAACAGCELHLLRLGDGDLRLALGGAIALVYPTIYEGFGMPIAEAMGSGCPVITAPFASLPEVAGDAAIIVNPYDQAAFAEALVSVQQPRLRAELIARGAARSRMFSWTRMAESLAAALSETAAEPATGVGSR